MKKVILFTMLVMGCTFATQAQSNGPAKGERREERKKMMAELNLTEEQAKKLKETNEDFRTKASKIRDNSAINEEEQRKQMKALNEERQTKLKEFLTAEQVEKLKEGRKHGKK